MTRLCLNMIVRNEADKIERMLASIDPYVVGYAITDTGSTDDTMDVIERHAHAAGKKVVFSVCEFESFSQARNYALDTACSQEQVDFDYLLLCDADMELKVTNPAAFDTLSGTGYDILQHAGGVIYANRRLVRRDQIGRYVGATHEYLDVATAGTVDGAFFIDHADGSNRKDKFTRDIALLLADLKRDPNNGRSWYYLGQSYRDAGQHKRAAKAYLRRAEMPGWDEETWSSRYNYGHSIGSDGDEAGFVKAMFDAYAMRPNRLEPIYDLAKHYREKPTHQHVVTMLTEPHLNAPFPTDMLFVDTHTYTTGLREEFSIAAWYVPEKRAHGFKITDDLALDPRISARHRNEARARLYHYLKPLSDFMPMQVTSIPNPDPDYTALNPSIASDNGQLMATVRTVNYRIAEDGSYRIKATDGSINRENPIHTRNYLVKLNDDLTVHSADVIGAPLPAPLFPLVVGYEDMRLFRLNGHFHVSATLRQNYEHGVPQQVIAPVMQDQAGCFATGFPREMSDGSQCEKNWMPICNNQGHFFYNLTTIVDTRGRVLRQDDVNAAIENIRGGSQVIEFFGGWLACVHEAYYVPGSVNRYYMHRFVWWDADMTLRHISPPFVFNDRVIEFAAGMCWHPSGQEIVISYGFKDVEARLARVRSDDLREFVFHGHAI